MLGMMRTVMADTIIYLPYLMYRVVILPAILSAQCMGREHPRRKEQRAPGVDANLYRLDAKLGGPE